MNPNGPPAGPPARPDVKTEGPLATGERFRPVALAALTTVLLGLCVVLAVPFYPALTWAAALAVIAWPLHGWVADRVRRPGLAAALSTLAVTIAVVGPGLFVAYHLAREAALAADRAKQEPAEGIVRDRLARAPGLGGVVAWMDRVNVDIDREVRAVVERYTRDASGLLEGSLQAAVQAAVCLFVLYHLLRDRGPLLRQVRTLLPMAPAEADRVFARAAGSVYANLYATAVTSVLDGVAGGVMFWVLGLPSPVLWGVVMFVLSFVPMLGTWLVWAPAAAYLGMTGRWPETGALVLWGVAMWFVVDNVVYVRIAGDRMRLHQVPALIAFLGGLAVFGASGMVLGPGILAVTAAVLDVWHRRAARPPGAVAAIDPNSHENQVRAKSRPD